MMTEVSDVAWVESHLSRLGDALNAQNASKELKHAFALVAETMLQELSSPVEEAVTAGYCLQLIELDKGNEIFVVLPRSEDLMEYILDNDLFEPSIQLAEELLSHYHQKRSSVVPSPYPITCADNVLHALTINDEHTVEFDELLRLAKLEKLLPFAEIVELDVSGHDTMLFNDVRAKNSSKPYHLIDLVESYHLQIFSSSQYELFPGEPF